MINWNLHCTREDRFFFGKLRKVGIETHRNIAENEPAGILDADTVGPEREQV
jgi:hypothetical protein